jgi:hypothetical protein
MLNLNAIQAGLNYLQSFPCRRNSLFDATSELGIPLTFLGRILVLQYCDALLYHLQVRLNFLGQTRLQLRGSGPKRALESPVPLWEEIGIPDLCADDALSP